MSNITPRWVLDRIYEAEHLNSDILNLSANSGHAINERLTELPDELLRLHNLKALYIKNHGIRGLGRLYDLNIRNPHLEILEIDSSSSRIPNAIGNFQDIKELSLSGNFTDIPPSIGNLKQLRRLELSGSAKGIPFGDGEQEWYSGSLKVIPDALENLVNLKKLALAGVFTKIPAFLGKLNQLISLELTGMFDDIASIALPTSLKILALRGTYEHIPDELLEGFSFEYLSLSGKFEKIPYSLGDVTLNRLHLHGSYSGLPEDIEEYTQLEHLALSGKFNVLPKKLFDISSLRHIDLSYSTRLEQIQSDILRLENLEQLDLPDLQYLVKPPPEVLNQPVDKLQALTRYYNGLENEKVKIYEAKLLILGEGLAGKTTLTRKIKDPHYELKQEDRTHAIDVVEWNFNDDKGQQYDINIWDFGGQHIYHETHQFFLSKRSIYILLDDSRTKELDYNKWLQTIRLFGGMQPPIIIVHNEIDDVPCKFDQDLQRKFDANVVRANFASGLTGRGLDKIISNIKFKAQVELPHIGEDYPKQRIEIRNELEKRNDYFITFEEYEIICIRCGLVNQDEQKEVLDMLHDLGSCLHFKDDKDLKRFVILNRHWATKAVYDLLNDVGVAQRSGEFFFRHLLEIWKGEAYKSPESHKILIALMEKFKLCYQISKGHYIAPQKLPDTSPKYKWSSENEIVMHYKYEFMPMGLIRRLMVELHNLIFDKKVWFSGFLLVNGESKAEIVEDKVKREIRIRVNGDDKILLLGKITLDLDAIHKTMHGLKYERYIACNCLTCRGSIDPDLFLYDDCKRYKDAGIYLRCDKSLKEIQPHVLLNSYPQNLQDNDNKKQPETPANPVVNLNLDVNLTQGDMTMSNENNNQSRKFGNFGGDYVEGPKSTYIKGDMHQTGISNNSGGTSRDELNELFAELAEKLRQAPQEKFEDIEAVEAYAEQAASLSAQDKPNKKRLEITADGLKKAAKNLEAVAPIAVKIAKILLMM